jgi:zinc transport system substrate-binding protein
LTDILVALDTENATYFRTNAEAFILELETLDVAFAEVVADSMRSTLVFGDRFPFLYLTESHGLTAYAAFDGCSNETYVSPARIASLIEIVQSQDISVVFHIELSDRRIAGVIAEATGAVLLEMHSAHNVTQAEFDEGITYIEIMQRNVEQLRKALN